MVDKSYLVERAIDQLRETWGNRTNQFRILSIGDSYASTDNSFYAGLWRRLVDDRGWDGVGTVNHYYAPYYHTLLIGPSSEAETINYPTHGTTNGVAAPADKYSEWTFEHWRIYDSTNSWVRFYQDGENSPFNLNLYSDTVRLIWKKVPYGGDFKLQKQIGTSGTWSDVATIDGSNDPAQFTSADYDLISLTNWNFRVIGGPTSGTNIVLGIVYSDSTGNGVITSRAGSGGLAIEDWDDSFTSNEYATVFNAHDPDLIIFGEAINTAGVSVNDYLNGTGLGDALKGMDCPVVICGQFPVYSENKQEQAAIQLELAQSNQFTFIDYQYPSQGSYQFMKDNGYLIDGNVHLRHPVGSIWAGEILYSKIFAGIWLDLDEDDIDDDWEVMYFGSKEACDPNADPDGDRFTNIQEYNNDTDPHTFDVGSIMLKPAIGVELEWKSVAGTNYQIQCSDDLTPNSWKNLGSVVVGNGKTNAVFDSIRDTDAKFYRVIVIP